MNPIYVENVGSSTRQARCSLPHDGSGTAWVAAASAKLAAMTTTVVGVRLIHPLLDYLRAREVPLAPLLGRVGLDVDQVEQPDGRIDARRAAQLWEEAAKRVRDPLLGLHVGTEVTRDSFDLLSQVVSVSETLRDMGDKLARFSPLAVPQPLYTLRERGESAFWTLQSVFPGKHCVRHLCELAVSLGVTYTKRYTRDPRAVRAVFFDHGPGAHEQEYAQALGVPVSFSRAESGFEIVRRWLDAPLAQADRGLSRVLGRYAEQTLRAQPKADDLTQRVCDAIEAQLTTERAASVTGVSRQLGTSARSLQRRLSEDGKSFQALLDQVRKGLALRLLDEERVSIANATERLGFSDPAAFRRAFKRWTGHSPSAHLKRPR